MVFMYKYFLLNLLIASIFSQDSFLFFLNKGDLVFDVGAHTGEYTDKYLHMGCSVVCVEPQNYCFDVLKNKYFKNNSVFLENNGCDSSSCVRKFYECESARAISTFSQDWKKGRFKQYEWSSEYYVTMTTLDELIKKYGEPQYIKIDVEGFEFEVLKGLRSPVRYLSFEFAHEFLDKTYQCIKYLQRLGYMKFNYISEANPNFENPNWMSADDLMIQLRSKDAMHWGDVLASFE